MTSFYIHGPKVINGYTVYAVTEGKENGTVWALCPTKEYAQKIARLLEASRIQDQVKKEHDFDTRFKQSWQRDTQNHIPFKQCSQCINWMFCRDNGRCVS